MSMSEKEMLAMAEEMRLLQEEQLELRRQLLDRKELMSKLDQELFQLEQKNMLDSNVVKELQLLEAEYERHLADRDMCISELENL
jgi:hypothetical protein